MKKSSPDTVTVLVTTPTPLPNPAIISTSQPVPVKSDPAATTPGTQQAFKPNTPPRPSLLHVPPAMGSPQMTTPAPPPLVVKWTLPSDVNQLTQSMLASIVANLGVMPQITPVMEPLRTDTQSVPSSSGQQTGISLAPAPQISLLPSDAQGGILPTTGQNIAATFVPPPQPPSVIMGQSQVPLLQGQLPLSTLYGAQLQTPLGAYQTVAPQVSSQVGNLLKPDIQSPQVQVPSPALPRPAVYSQLQSPAVLQPTATVPTAQPKSMLGTPPRPAVVHMPISPQIAMPVTPISTIPAAQQTLPVTGSKPTITLPVVTNVTPAAKGPVVSVTPISTKRAAQPAPSPGRSLLKQTLAGALDSPGHIPTHVPLNIQDKGTLPSTPSRLTTSPAGGQVFIPIPPSSLTLDPMQHFKSETVPPPPHAGAQVSGQFGQYTSSLLVPQSIKTEEVQPSIVYQSGPRDRVEVVKTPSLPLTPGGSVPKPVSEKVTDQLARLATKPKVTASYEQPGVEVKTLQLPAAPVPESLLPPGISNKLEHLIKGSLEVRHALNYRLFCRL